MYNKTNHLCQYMGGTLILKDYNYKNKISLM